MKQCMDCVFMMQGTTCCFCANPNQGNKELRNYVYWTFECKLHKKGDRLPNHSPNNFTGSKDYNGFKNDSMNVNPNMIK